MELNVQKSDRLGHHEAMPVAADEIMIISKCYPKAGGYIFLKQLCKSLDVHKYDTV